MCYVRKPSLLSGTYLCVSCGPKMTLMFKKFHYLYLKTDNIKMNLLEVGCGGMDWIELAEGRDRWLALVSAVMNLRVP